VSAGRIFLYGTLMPGEERWPALQPYAASWRPVTAEGRMWDTGRGYPAVRFDRAGDLGPGGIVAGVLLDIRSGRLAEAVTTLDLIEEEGNLYRRVDVATSDGPAMGYEWIGPLDGMAPLAGGWPAATARDGKEMLYRTSMWRVSSVGIPGTLGR